MVAAGREGWGRVISVLAVGEDGLVRRRVGAGVGVEHPVVGELRLVGGMVGVWE